MLFLRKHEVLQVQSRLLTQANAFVDGNKRVAASVSEIFLELNGAELNATNDEIVELFLKIAARHSAREVARHVN